jgi:hypothetical protein
VIWRSWPAVALIAAAAPMYAQTVTVRGGSGVGPAIVAQALSAPHTLIERGSVPRLVRRDSAFSQTVVSIGRNVIVEGAVHGDLIVIGADVYMHPGGRVDGRAIAIGGGVYESMLAHTSEAVMFTDFTYDVQSGPTGYSLTYRPIEVDSEPAFRLPVTYGLRLPTYDRMDGLSLPVAPRLRVPGSKIVFEPELTYRSHLGRLDPGLSVRLPLAGGTTLEAAAERTTLTNDAWIWSDFINSIEFLFLGDDARNYYRATRGNVTLSKRWRTVEATIEPFVGARVERARSLPRDSNATSVPWTFLNRGDPDDSRRPNPSVDPATIVSGVAGSRLLWTNGRIVAQANMLGEVGAPTNQASIVGCTGTTCTLGNFEQFTLDGRIGFPTFGNQSIGIDGHFVATHSRNTPRQRWAYLGGPGSIPTLELLQRGGDELIFADFRYTVPINRVTLPVVGAPAFTIREVLAGAAVSTFPTIAQAIGGRLSAGPLYLEILVDPVTRRGAKGFGISLAR